MIIEPPEPQMSPAPEGAVAIFIDVSWRLGAVKIFKRKTTGPTTYEYLGGVGSEARTDFVMIPWNSGWNYVCIGSLRIAFGTPI